MTDTLHSTAGVFTVLYSVFGVGAVICAFIVARRSMVRMHHIIIGAVALGISMLLLSAVPGVLFAIPAVFLVGMGSILYLTAANAIVQIEAQSDMHGRVISLQTVVAGGATLVGAPLLGWIADTMGGRMPILIGGLASLVAAAFGYFALKRYGAR
ncbi:MAG: MFS transporter [Coriobacteriia bacterium]|nr:MFS transporter [Coriobacteriia bacterium]